MKSSCAILSVSIPVSTEGNAYDGAAQVEMSNFVAKKKGRNVKLLQDKAVASFPKENKFDQGLKLSQSYNIFASVVVIIGRTI
jgi:hypothetical protein